MMTSRLSERLFFCTHLQSSKNVIFPKRYLLNLFKDKRVTYTQRSWPQMVQNLWKHRSSAASINSLTNDSFSKESIHQWPHSVMIPFSQCTHLINDPYALMSHSPLTPFSHISIYQWLIHQWPLLVTHSANDSIHHSPEVTWLKQEIVFIRV